MPSSAAWKKAAKRYRKDAKRHRTDYLRQKDVLYKAGVAIHLARKVFDGGSENEPAKDRTMIFTTSTEENYE